MTENEKVSVLFVCCANICRSPMAQGLLMRDLQQQNLVDRIEVDSAGTHVSKPGHRPDQRARRVATASGAKIDKFRSRMVAAEDFQLFDYIIAMDRGNLHNLETICPQEYKNKLFLILEFASQSGQEEVPDPYFGNFAGFERVTALLEMGCRGLLNHIRAVHDITL